MLGRPAAEDDALPPVPVGHGRDGLCDPGDEFLGGIVDLDVQEDPDRPISRLGQELEQIEQPRHGLARLPQRLECAELFPVSLTD